MPPETLDPPTLLGGDSTSHGEDHVARVPALTILWHPDVGRVGECAVLRGQRVEVSRLEPLFQGRAARKEGGSPLSDTYVSSRTPSFAFASAGDGFQITPVSPDARVKVNGALLRAPVGLSTSDLDHGVLITLSRRIVLCLHRIRSSLSRARQDHGLVGTSDAIDDVRREIDRVADLNVPVLLRGETGTGKGMVAAALVAASPRTARPFLSLNMGATVASTAASDLFGHERGAFTGAGASTQGLFAAADGGSLFLDEVGLTAPDVQKMLLRVVETGEILPVGGTRVRKVDVRFIAATDTDLESAIATGTFSPALFQRLARYQITLPPLRARREDFGILLVHFLRRALEKYGEPDRLAVSDTATPWLSAASVAALAAFRWPGNVREFENIAGQIVLFSRGQGTASLPPSVRSLLTTASHEVPSRAAVSGAHEPSNEEVAAALARHGSVNRAAAALKVSRTKFYELRVRNPLIRSVTAISDVELSECREECQGDVPRMAALLGVPLKALKDRLARLTRGPR